MLDRASIIPANDNGKTQRIRVLVAESPPICRVEVEIFDLLISNTSDLVANDNACRDQEENA